LVWRRKEKEKKKGDFLVNSLPALFSLTSSGLGGTSSSSGGRRTGRSPMPACGEVRGERENEEGERRKRKKDVGAFLLARRASVDEIVGEEREHHFFERDKKTLQSKFLSFSR
jgi:hypothetical protein